MAHIKKIPDKNYSGIFSNHAHKKQIKFLDIIFLSSTFFKSLLKYLLSMFDNKSFVCVYIWRCKYTYAGNYFNVFPIFLLIKYSIGNIFEYLNMWIQRIYNNVYISRNPSEDEEDGWESFDLWIVMESGEIPKTNRERNNN